MKFLYTSLLLLLVACGGQDFKDAAAYQSYSTVGSTSEGNNQPSLRSTSSEEELWYYRIDSYIKMVFFLPWSNEDRSAHIKEIALRSNVTVEQISKATRYSVEDINNFLAVGKETPFRDFSPEEQQLLSTKLNPLNIKDANSSAELLATGKWLNLVKNIRFNGRILPIRARGTEAVLFTIDKSECGTLSAELYDGSTINFGFHTITNKCDNEVLGIRAVQNLVRPGEVFINGKTLGVQAAVKSALAPLDLRVQVEQYGTVVFEDSMIPPQSTVPSFDNGAFYYARIPGQFVKPGIKINVVGYPEKNRGISIFKSMIPSVDVEKKTVKITIVQFSTPDGRVANVPDLEMIRSVLIKTLPVPDDVELGLVKGTLSNNMRDNGDWSIALGDLSRVRYNTLTPKGDFKTIFYGFVPYRGTSITGIAFLNGVVALGIDTWTSKIDGTWAQVFTHELGHVLNLKHAPCGGAPDTDPAYPYLNGLIGQVPPFNLLDGWQQGLGMYDAMGYCRGMYFSDYNYDKLKQTVESRFIVKETNLAATKLDKAPSVGFKVLIRQDKVFLLNEQDFNFGINEHAIIAKVNGQERKAEIYRIDHSTDIHVWIEGAVERPVEITLDNITYFLE